MGGAGPRSGPFAPFDRRGGAWRGRILVHMRKVIGRINGSVLIESVVVVDVDGRSNHYYKLAGGPDDGREFSTLAEISDYVLAAQHRQTA